MVNTTVLIVDDEARFAEVLARRLGRRKFNVLATYSGPEALDVLENETNIDVVILDMGMPGMDGIETLRRIKVERPEVEVIILTGCAGIAIAIKAMKSGAFDCMSKPCGVEDICARVIEAKERKLKREKIQVGGPASRCRLDVI